MVGDVVLTIVVRSSVFDSLTAELSLDTCKVEILRVVGKRDVSVMVGGPEVDMIVSSDVVSNSAVSADGVTVLEILGFVGEVGILTVVVSSSIVASSNVVELSLDTSKVDVLTLEAKSVFTSVLPETVVA